MEDSSNHPGLDRLEQFGPADSPVLSALCKIAQPSSSRPISACSRAGSYGCGGDTSAAYNEQHYQKTKAQANTTLQGSNCCHVFPHKGYLNAKADNDFFVITLQ